MTTLCEGLTFGPPPKSATWRTLKAEHDVFVNLRPKTDTSHWYFPDGWDEMGKNTNKLTSKLSPAWSEVSLGNLVVFARFFLKSD